MATLKNTIFLIILSTLSYVSVQGFSHRRLRDVTPSSETRERIQQLSTSMTAILGDVQEGVQGSKLRAAMLSIAEQADQIIEETGVAIDEQDVKTFVLELSSDYKPLLETPLKFGIKMLDLSLELLKALSDRLSTDQDDLYVTVAAIRSSAAEIAKNADFIEKAYIHMFKTLSKRQKSNPGWSLGVNPGSGLSLSHTWNNANGNTGTLGGNLGLSPHGLNGGISGSYKWNNANGNTGSLGGILSASPQGLSGGIQGSYKWNNGRTSVGGGVNFDPLGKPNIGFSFTHRF